MVRMLHEIPLFDLLPLSIVLLLGSIVLLLILGRRLRGVLRTVVAACLGLVILADLVGITFVYLRTASESAPRKETPLPPPGLHYASEANAYLELKPLLVKSQRGEAKRPPTPCSDVVFMANGCFSDIRDEKGWQKYDTPQLHKSLGEANAHLDAFTSGSRCDYLEVPEGEPPLDTLAIRDTARALHTRAMLSIHDGKTSAAVQDIEALIGMGRLLMHYPRFHEQMVGVAVFSIASDACVQYYVALRGQSEAMNLLAGVFAREREQMTVKLDVDALWRYSSALDESQRTRPNEWGQQLARACEKNIRGRHMQFQQLQLAVALERYKAVHGAYPASLDDLAPEFLVRVPREPFNGERYSYAVVGTEFSLKVDWPDDWNTVGPLSFPLE